MMENYFYTKPKKYLQLRRNTVEKVNKTKHLVMFPALKYGTKPNKRQCFVGFFFVLSETDLNLTIIYKMVFPSSEVQCKLVCVLRLSVLEMLLLIYGVCLTHLSYYMN